jgi:acyl-CoA thioesterase FadM
MARVVIELPSEFRFSTNIGIRITDINYGGHAGNDTILSLIHEARMQFLKSVGYTEMNCGGTGLIMTDAAIEFKKELFYGEVVTMSVAAVNFSKISFELFYKLEKQMEGKPVLVAKVKTSMVCFDYTAKKVTAFSPEVIEKISSA